MTYRGSCFCGAVAIEATGEPVGMGYCHCRSCRSWSAAPVSAFTLWPPEAVAVTKGGDHLATFEKTKGSERQFCRLCGGHVMSNHPLLGVRDILAATIPDLDFQPALHVHYQETVLPMKDGLPKLQDLPADLGGSGEILPE